MNKCKLKVAPTYKLGDKLICVYSTSHSLPDDKVLEHKVYRTYVVSDGNIEYINSVPNNYTFSWIV